MDKQNEVLYLIMCSTVEKSYYLMDELAFQNMYKLSKVSRKERTVYFRDGRIFRFVGTAERTAFIGSRNWNKLDEKEFEEGFLNDDK